MKPDNGWCVNEALLAELFEGNPVPTDAKKLEKRLCDIDIREYGDPCISNRMNKEALNGPVVLQLIRYRNVSKPKVKEDVRGSDDIARLSLTDGHTSISALLLESVKGLNSDTPPGTKLLLTGTLPVESGFVILAPQNVVVIGGRVEKLIEKWTIEKHSLGESLRGTRSDGKAPKWISFGKRAATSFDPSTKDFKANSAIESTMKKDSDDKVTFELQRKEIIEAVEEGSAKVFAAPKIQPPQKSHDSNVTRSVKAPAIKERGHDRRAKKGRRRGGDSDDEEVPAEFARPSKPSTLFDFVATNVISDADSSHLTSRTSDNSSATLPQKSVQYPTRQNHRTYNERIVNKGGSHPKRGGEQRKPLTHSSFSRGSADHNQKPRNSNITRRDNRADVSRGEPHSRKPQQSFATSTANTSRTYGQDSSGFISDRKNYASSSVPSASRNQRGQSNVGSSSEPVRDRFVSDFSNMRLDGGPRRYDSNIAAPPRNNPPQSSQFAMPRWKVGDQCKAPWNDGMYYLATIVNMGPADMCAVRYNDYGNIGTVPQAVLLIV